MSDLLLHRISKQEPDEVHANVRAGRGIPVVLAAIDIVIVRLEARSLETLKFLAAIVKCPACLGERHAPNPSLTGQTPSLSFDVHNPTFVRFRLSRRS